VIEVVYQCETTQAPVDADLFVAVDLGVSVLAALTSNKPGFIPRLVNGRPIKAVNQLYNKQRARHQSRLAKQNRFTSRQLDRITTKRHRRIMQYLHTASRRIIDRYGTRRDRHADPGQESPLETARGVGQEAQSGVCATPACQIY
jgi:putative transposase